MCWNCVSFQIFKAEILPFLYSFVRRHSLSCTKLLSPHSSGEGEEDKPEIRASVANKEIVRRGALILFCDYVVRALKHVMSTISTNAYVTSPHTQTHTRTMSGKYEIALTYF